MLIALLASVMTQTVSNDVIVVMSVDDGEEKEKCGLRKGKEGALTTTFGQTKFQWDNFLLSLATFCLQRYIFSHLRPLRAGDEVSTSGMDVVA